MAVLREAVACGVNHIDTSDFYGPHVTNRLIREALHPYADDLVLVTKIGAHRSDDGLIDALAEDRIAYVPYFPLGGFTLLQSSTLSAVAQRLGASPMQVAGLAATAVAEYPLDPGDVVAGASARDSRCRRVDPDRGCHGGTERDRRGVWGLIEENHRAL